MHSDLKINERESAAKVLRGLLTMNSSTAPPHMCRSLNTKSKDGLQVSG